MRYKTSTIRGPGSTKHGSRNIRRRRRHHDLAKLDAGLSITGRVCCAVMRPILTESILNLAINCFVAFATCLSVSGLVAAQDCMLNGAKVDASDGRTTANKTGLMRCVDRASGHAIQEKELRDGKFVGLERFYQDGKLQREDTVNAKGNREGRSREYAANGQVLRDNQYENGTLAGLQKSFYPNGQLQRATYYGKSGNEQAYAEFNRHGQLQDLRCGERALLAPTLDDAHWCGFSGDTSKLELFRDNGAVRARSHYLAGKRIWFEALNDDGRLETREEVRNGLRTKHIFYPEGGQRQETIWREQDKRQLKESEKRFAPSGVVQLERHWADGQLAREQTFYLNGQPLSKSEFGGEGRTAWRQTTDYFDNGKVSATGRFNEADRYRSAPVGVQQQFNQDGTLIAESTYDDQGHLTREKAWDKTGVLLRDDAVFEDGSRKAFARQGNTD
jgi:antitoxin component YwqK of YwqJK toxin-antitoxin module